MSFINKLYESIFRRGNGNIVSKPSTTKDSVSQKYIETDMYAMYRLISQIRDVGQSREYKYAEYDIMASDVIIKTALGMYADDSTQVDENSNTIISVESTDEHLKKDLTTFLTKMKVEDRLRDVSYNLGKYGNKFWKLYMNEDHSDIHHIEEIDDPGCVLDLWYQGEPLYFAENSDDTHLYKNSDEFNLYDHDAFVHFYIRSGDSSDVIEIVDHNKFDTNGDPIILKYKIVEGEALIEAVRVIWRILRSLEDSLLAARLAKADFVRIFNIEVGDSSSTDTRLIVNKVKKIFDSSVSMDIRNGTYSATKSARPFGDPIFNSVSKGNGAISVESIGGDFEVKSIVDIDYFNNLLFSGLRIPKPWMGFEETISGGFGNDGTMVQLDIRYGKFIKKIIDSYIIGITDLCNIWLKIHKRSYQIGKFKIVYNSPSTTEELAKVKELLDRVEAISTLVDTISGQSTGINKTKLIYELLDQFVPYKVFIDKIKPLLKDAVDDSELDVKVNKLQKEAQIKQLEQQKNNPSSNPVDDLNDTSNSTPSAGLDNPISSADEAEIDKILSDL